MADGRHIAGYPYVVQYGRETPSQDGDYWLFYKAVPRRELHADLLLLRTVKRIIKPRRSRGPTKLNTLFGQADHPVLARDTHARVSQ